MSFWKKLFGKKEAKVTSEFQAERERLNQLNLKTVADLENLLKPLIRKSTRIEVLEASKPPEHAALKSHFGGPPYFEQGAAWPTSKKGDPLSFIFQIFNEETFELPKDIELIQFFYDWEAFPWETQGDGWLVKIYKQVDIEKQIAIEPAAELETSKYCELVFHHSLSLPDWEGIDSYEQAASDLSCVLKEDEPWEHYDHARTKLIGEHDLQSQLGGYPQWVQGESTPKNKDGRLMKLLFQIDSEDNADLMWGDVGLIYVFYDEASGQIAFELQCH